MAKFKVLVPNQIEIGKFKSDKGVLNIVNPTAKEKKKIENAIATKMIKEIATTEAPKK